MGRQWLVAVALCACLSGCARFIAGQVVETDATRVAQQAESLLPGSTGAAGFSPASSLDVLGLRVISLAYGDVNSYLIIILSDSGVPEKNLADARQRLRASQPHYASKRKGRKGRAKFRRVRGETVLVAAQGHQKEALLEVKEDESGYRTRELTVVLNDPQGKAVGCYVTGPEKTFPEAALADFFKSLAAAPLSASEESQLPPPLDSIPATVQSGPRQVVLWLDDDRQAYRLKEALNHSRLCFTSDGGEDSHLHRLGDPVRRNLRVVCRPTNPAKLPALVKVLNHRGYHPVELIDGGRAAQIGEAQDRSVYDLSQAVSRESRLRPWLQIDELKVENVSASAAPCERLILKSLSASEFARLQGILRECALEGGTWFPVEVKP